MNELAESAGTVTAIGMGTVFVCLVLLYGMTHMLGAIVGRAQAPAPKPKPAVPATSDPVETESGTAAPSGPSRETIAAAITLVLARHRASRARSNQPSGVDPWKLAGRVRALRSD